ncbi:uncharacterized protein PV09_03417 [Verruconis gallopava]|uniref:Kinesin motor domain-containing protein n=1 Tax=Verruconis gallopava TaxID=253628 RepID=A0A0D1YXZ8_9PEZI|nr:uncharacterized protein PV09_03417 [Verruconis gallopava]KIW05537.1 hypothetical protein PV09_03417 [Verruconis gallopava]
MSVRVVARIRPLLKGELEKDVIVTASHGQTASASSRPQVVRIPNPKNDAEQYSFQFNSVYEQGTTQQELFDGEVAPTVKHLFNGFDVTIFAYGVTGTGKTHTMRGGKSLADRGVIPRLLSAIYRRARKVEKDSAGETTVKVAMSYYEIYNDRVFDLFEAPEKRTPSGLPIRDNNGKTVVVGLSERPCTTLKEFEQLYDQANINRSTSATKLNAHSSRSHAILCVKLIQSTGENVLVSTASAIDLAGSEDNRRTDNNRDRLVESSAINKSLFVLAQCVEAISKRQARIPYRESKMTRILALGQNNGMTIMILNLAPVRSYHLDTLSSLNFANRTKKIEVNEIENEPMVKGSAIAKVVPSATGPTLQRQPLRPLASMTNIQRQLHTDNPKKPVKSFLVYSDKSKSDARPPNASAPRPTAQKRSQDASFTGSNRPMKSFRSNDQSRNGLSKEEIEALIDRKVDEKIAEQALSAKVKSVESLPADLQNRLDALEQRVAEKEDSEGLQFLLMAKQHHARGEDASALRMYKLAQPYFPHNEKLARKIETLGEKIRQKHELKSREIRDQVSKHARDGEDSDYHDDYDPRDEGEESFVYKPKKRTAHRTKVAVFKDESFNAGPPSPRTQQLLDIINTRDIAQIRALKGVGNKKAEAIVSSLCEMAQGENEALITDLVQLGALKGVGAKTVENMRVGLAFTA